MQSNLQTREIEDSGDLVQVSLHVQPVLARHRGVGLGDKALTRPLLVHLMTASLSGTTVQLGSKYELSERQCQQCSRLYGEVLSPSDYQLCSPNFTRASEV